MCLHSHSTVRQQPADCGTYKLLPPQLTPRQNKVYRPQACTQPCWRYTVCVGANTPTYCWFEHNKHNMSGRQHVQYTHNAYTSVHIHFSDCHILSTGPKARSPLLAALSRQCRQVLCIPAGGGQKGSNNDRALCSGINSQQGCARCIGCVARLPTVPVSCHGSNHKERQRCDWDRCDWPLTETQ
jgi:hypothetical protein